MILIQDFLKEGIGNRDNFSKLLRAGILLRTFVLGFLFNYNFMLDCNASVTYIRRYESSVRAAKITCRIWDDCARARGFGSSDFNLTTESGQNDFICLFISRGYVISLVYNPSLFRSKYLHISLYVPFIA